MNTREYFLAVWPSEVDLTINAFNMLPAGKLDYRPHPKTRSATEIIEHVIAQPHDMEQALREGQIDHRRKWPFEDLAEAVSAYAAHCKTVAGLVEAAADNDWDKKVIPFMVKGKTMRQGPLRDVCFAFMFDMIHHRGQLSTYYRPMGGKNPFIYGPTAEMIEELKAGRNKQQ